MSFTKQALLCAALLVFPRAAEAHALNPGLLEIAEHEPGNGHYTVLWKPPRAVTLDGASTAAADGLRPVFPPSCSERATRLSGPARGIAVFALDCGATPLSAVSFAGGAGLPTEVVVRSIDALGRETTALVRGAAVDLALPESAPRSRLETLAEYAALGLAHIAAGLDHLLFVGCLLLLAARLRDLIASVTAFTAAHSLTLALAATGQVRLPPEPVEILIALSVALAAAEAVRGHDDATGRPARVWGMAFAFGLLHGFGFAGALAELGLPAQAVPSALLGFNLGVEAGQLIFVTVAWWPLRAGLALVSRLPSWMATVPGYAIGCVAAVWTAERLAGAF